MEVIQRPVERIDDPGVVTLASHQPTFFGKDGMVRECVEQDGADRGLAGPVHGELKIVGGIV